MTDSASLGDAARAIMAANAYLTMATADENGRPWATPVWYANRDLEEFFWVSRPGARHSKNLSATAAVGMVIFDSSAPVGDAAAVYVEATAAEVVDAADRADALAVYNECAASQGLRAWADTDVTGAAQFRMYRARASAVYLLDEHDGRLPLA